MKCPKCRNKDIGLTKYMKCPKCGNKDVEITKKNLWFKDWAPFEVLGWGKVKGYHYCEICGWRGERTKVSKKQSFFQLLIVLLVCIIIILFIIDFVK